MPSPLKSLKRFLLRLFPLTRKMWETRNTQTPILFSMWFMQKILGFNRNASWPVHFTSQVLNPDQIKIGIETSPGFMPGCYIQGLGGLSIGDYTQIGPHVSLIGANHDPYDNRIDITKDGIHIGAYSWLGTGCFILPGVKLGDFTIVGAGAVVTKSFPEGYVIIGGNPARVIKSLDREKCRRHRSEYEYRGYLKVQAYKK